MSQEGILDVIGSNPQIPTEFIANSGSAIPIANTLEILGSVVLAGTNPLRTIGSGNTIDIQAQISQAIGATNVLNIGLSAFNSADFSVDANGFVSLLGPAASSSFNVDAATPPGTDPVVPDGSGIVTITGGQVAAGTTTNVIQTNSLAANTYTIQIQRSSAQAATTIGANGVAHFSSAMFAVDANGFVTLAGGGQAIDSIDVQANTVPGTDPVVPTAAGVVTVNGAAVANHSVVLETRSRAANAYNLEVQYATSAAATDATKSGVAHFNSTQFTVDANGFVATSSTGVANTITGDSGGALSPTAGNWNLLGRSGSKTAGTGSTLTINSPPFSDQGGSTTVTLNSGSFATAAITLTTPATAGLLDGDLLQFVATNGVLVIQLAATQVAHIGSLATSVAGNMTSTATGDSVTLRYQVSTNDWWATSVIGTWVMA